MGKICMDCFQLGPNEKSSNNTSDNQPRMTKKKNRKKWPKQEVSINPHLEGVSLIQHPGRAGTPGWVHTGPGTPISPWLDVWRAYCLHPRRRKEHRPSLRIIAHHRAYVGVSLNGGTHKTPPTSSFLVGKPAVVGYHHFRKPPCLVSLFKKQIWAVSSSFRYIGRSTLNLFFSKISSTSYLEPFRFQVWYLEPISSEYDI